ncbi:MAG: single-stranded DNA-binding protein [Ruminococcaceae bacterium]|nr:single-stranded DNA-binding protein [Oscillospiraceae bacterium]
MNDCKLCGKVEALPILSHQHHDHVFDTFPLSVERLSGTYDFIRVIAPHDLCSTLQPGDTVAVTGELRSYNDREAVHNRLKISIWAREILPSEDEPDNFIHLIGSLCKPAVYRRTPFGREIADLMLCVEREYSAAHVHRCDYIPCIAWGSVARRMAVLPSRSMIELCGRIQSRRYIKVIDGKPEERTAYEVSIATAEVMEEENVL